MKKYGKLLRKFMVLAALLFCLAWLANDRSSAAQAETCDECFEAHAACVLECGSGNQTCLNNCHIARNHCLLFCD